MSSIPVKFLPSNVGTDAITRPAFELRIDTDDSFGRILNAGPSASLDDATALSPVNATAHSGSDYGSDRNRSGGAAQDENRFADQENGSSEPVGSTQSPPNSEPEHDTEKTEDAAGAPIEEGQVGTDADVEASAETDSETEQSDVVKRNPLVVEKSKSSVDGDGASDSNSPTDANASKSQTGIDPAATIEQGDTRSTGEDVDNDGVQGAAKLDLSADSKGDSQTAAAHFDQQDGQNPVQQQERSPSDGQQITDAAASSGDAVLPVSHRAISLESKAKRPTCAAELFGNGIR